VRWEQNQDRSFALHQTLADCLPRTIGDTERLIVTGSIAVLFTVFLTLQISYLFGNPGGRTGSGVSYADAVHRGFVELNIASSICAAVLFTLARYATPTRPRGLIRALEWLVLVQAQVLLLSAFYRVNLYEAAYGFTRLRLYVQVYAVVASVGLICLLLELRAQPVLDRLMRRVLTAAAIAFAAVVLVNSDALIARQNLQRYSHTGQLDVDYLTGGLGPDAVAPIVSALPSLSAPLATQVTGCLRDRYDSDRHREPTRWFEWNLRRAALYRALAKMDLSAPASSLSTCTTQQSAP
jgi:two-component system, OmpR family, sensor histidine kinase BaeS